MLNSASNRLISFLVCVFVIVFAFTGCGKGDTSSTPSSSDDDGVLIDFDESGPIGETRNQSDVSKDENKPGNSKNNDRVDKTTQKNTKTDASTPSGTSDPFKNVPSHLVGSTIKFAHWGDEGGSEYQKVINAFTKKTGIKVELVSYNQAEYVTTIAKQLAAKNGPDVIIENGFFPASLEIAQPLNDYFKDSIALSDPFWDAEINKIYTIGGKTYFTNSLKSVWQNVEMVFYNKALFVDNGLTSPQDYYDAGQWTYENLRKCMENVKKLGYIGGFADPEILATQMGESLIKYNSSKVEFTNNLMNAVPAYQFAAQNLKDGLWDTTSWWGTFQNGKIGIYVTSLYGAKYNGYFKDMDNNKIAVVPLPSSWNGKALKPADSARGYGIAQGARNPEAVAWFIRYFLDYDYYKAAGAKVFKNSNIEKIYFDKIVPEIKAKGRNFENDDGVLSYVSLLAKSLVSAVGDNPAQVSTEFAKMNNTYSDAVKKANEVLEKYKK